MSSSQPPVIRVLHLEDNARDAELISYRLERGGVPCDIVVAGSRESFDAALVEQSFDLILCDYNVPGYDGLRALKRAKEVRPEAPVIIISGTVGEEEAVHCLHTGATDYLLKQHLERLVPAVRRAIQEAGERRRRADAEQELHQREQRLSSIYEAVAETLFYLSVEPDGGYRFVSVNRAFVQATGLDYGDVVGRRLDEVVGEEAAQIAQEHCVTAIRERRTVRWEQEISLPAGTLVGEVSVVPVFDESGRCTHLVGSFRDLTERRRLEAQLRQSQKMESVGQLAGGIAHDFNNLLAVINGMAELTLLRLDEGESQLQRDLAEILRAGERAAALTGQLLAFSRKQILQPQIIDLMAIVSETGSLLRRLLGENIELHVVPSSAPVVIRADPGQIEQVILNLAVNARDAMPLGGTLTIETGQVTVEAEFGKARGVDVTPGPYATLSIGDTGIGMDEATQRQIFEPFFTTKGIGLGTGLGLSTVYGIVKQSDGFIWVTSQPGRGSTFTIYFPLVAGESAPAPSTQTEVPSTGTETILVVEDVGGLRKLITRTLEGAGYTVLAAATGAEALRLFEQHDGAVDLVITDVVMPGMSGRELAEQLEISHPALRVVYMSGYADDIVFRHGAGQRGLGVIRKPFGPKELRRRVREALDLPASPQSAASRS